MRAKAVLPSAAAELCVGGTGACAALPASQRLDA